jgi:hypothetical protein
MQRALTRRGAVNLHLTWYKKAKIDLTRAFDLSDLEEEKVKLSHLLKQVQNGLKKDAEAAEKQRISLKKAFDARKQEDDNSNNISDVGDLRTKPTRRNISSTVEATSTTTTGTETDLDFLIGKMPARAQGVEGTVRYFFSLLFRLIVGILYIIYVRARAKLGIQKVNRDKDA